MTKSVNMIDLMVFKNGLRLVMKELVRAVMTEVFTAAEKISLNKLNLQTEEKLKSLVVEAVDKILEMVAVTTPQCLMTSPEGEAGSASPPSEPVYILVYGNAAGDSKRVLLTGDANADSENKTDDVTTPNSESFLAAPDHEYARLSLPPPGPALGGGACKTPLPAKTPEPVHRCVQCGMLFPTVERLSDHQKKSHLACSACGAQFNGVSKLREHELEQHGLLPYACDYCPKRFNHKAHRDLHMKARHTGEKPCRCDVCGKAYTCVSVLKTHRATHFDKTFVCDECGKSFYHACHLTRHKAAHGGVRPHRCVTCGKGFAQAANLRSHQATHGGGERQLCSVCGKRFRCLKNHLISKHSHDLPAGELPCGGAGVACQVCGKKFPNASQLKAHQRSHTGEKPFHCDVCGKSYRLKELLRDHRYTHSGEKPYRCPQCPKTFSLATSFTRHRSIHSGETPYGCAACGKSFRLPTFLKAHLQTKAHLKKVQQMDAAPNADDL